MLGVAVWCGVSFIFASGTVSEEREMPCIVNGAEAAAADKIFYEEPIGPPEPTVKAVFINPAHGVLTSEYGERWGRKHTGIDIGGNEGSDIVAAGGGKVVFAGWVTGYGYYTVIDHENGFQTAYAHCSELLVSSGERVLKGQKIAFMGNTGNSTGTHLHFEVKSDGEYCNPLDYVVY